MNQFIFLNLRSVLDDRVIRRSLVDLYKELWKEPPWDEDFWTDELVNEDIEFALNQSDFAGKVAIKGTVSGLYVIGMTWGYRLPIDKFPFLSEIGREGMFYVDELGVDKSSRVSGIGSRLSDLLEEDARKFGYHSSILRTDVRGVAYPFYMNRGYIDSGIRDPEYQERAYMVKSLK